MSAQCFLTPSLYSKWNKANEAHRCGATCQAHIASALDFSAIVTIPWRGAVVWSGWVSAPAVRKTTNAPVHGPGRMLAPRLGQVPQLLWALTSSFLPGGFEASGQHPCPSLCKTPVPCGPSTFPFGDVGSVYSARESSPSEAERTRGLTYLPRSFSGEPRPAARRAHLGESQAAAGSLMRELEPRGRSTRGWRCGQLRLGLII